MAQLKTKHKEFIIKQLACFDPPSQVIDRVKEEFGIEVSRQQINYYNPENTQGNRQLATKWRHMFDKTRDAFLEGSVKIPIAHKQYRLRELQKSYEKLIGMGNIMGANQVLEQAAKEMGGAYTASGALAAAAGEGASVNFYQQVNNRIMQLNNKE